MNYILKIRIGNAKNQINRNIVSSLLLFLLQIPIFGIAQNNALKAINLKTNYLETPLGIDKLPVKFFWLVEAENRQGAEQKAYQIQVARDIQSLTSEKSLLWDSRMVESGKNFQIPYSGTSLKSRQQVWWRVKLWDENGNESKWSEPTWFETGLLEENEWRNAQWIGCNRNYLAPELAPKEVMGDWVSASEDQACRSFYKDVHLPDKPVVSAMAWWGFNRSLGRAGIVVNYDSELKVAKSAMDRATRSVKGGFLDLAFYLKPGEINRIQLLFRNPVKDIVATAGVRIVFADGEEMIVKSGADWKVEIEDELKLNSRINICESYGGCNFGQAEILTQTSLAPAWFRKSIPVKNGLQRGHLYLSALGYGMPYVNGEFVGDGLTSPPQSDYEEMAFYTTHDITKALKPGTNALSILLDGGWFHEVGGFGTNFSYGRPGIKALLVLEYDDGTTEWITSGKDWQWKEGAILSANIYRGERVDYRKDHDQWKFADSGKAWNPAVNLQPLTPKLVSMDIVPVRAKKQIQPVKKWKIGPKTWLFDMGEMMHGWIRLKLNEPEGSKIYIRYSEYAESDKIWNVPLSHWWCHGVIQSDIITCDGNTRVFEPVFTPKSYRFVEICGLSNEPKEDDVVGVLVHTDAPSLSTFESSDVMLNRIYDNGMRTFRNYMNHMFGDIPRERCLWGAESIYSWVPAFNCYDWAPNHRLMNDLWVSGRKAPGGIPGDIGVGLRISTQAHEFSWSITPIYLSYRILKHFGDLESVKTSYPVMNNMLHYFEKTSENGALPLEHMYGDHAPAHDIPRVKSNNQLVAAMNFYNSELQFAEMADHLGKTDDAIHARRHAEIIRNEVMKFYDVQNHTFGNSTHNSLALAHGILKDPREEIALANSLVDIFRENGHKFDGGFMGYEIYPMLTKYGFGDDALKMIRNPNYPGPAWSIKEYNATTFWEAYYYDKEYQMNRGLNFIAYAHPVGWMITDLSGIRADPDVAGGRRLILSPMIPKTEKLDWVKSSLKTMQGTVKSSWRLIDAKLEWEITVPANTEAEIHVPAYKPGIVIPPKVFKSIGFINGHEVYIASAGTYNIKSQIVK